MRMLGEMSAVNPTSGSFSQYAHDAIGPWAGFTIGWLYWFFWVIVIAIEAIAGAGIIQYWFHDIPLWLTSLILTIVLTLTNVYSVKSFGEFEYWFSSLKLLPSSRFSSLVLPLFSALRRAVNQWVYPILQAKADFSRRHQLRITRHCRCHLLFYGNRNCCHCSGRNIQPDRIRDKSDPIRCMAHHRLLRWLYRRCGGTFALEFSKYFRKPFRRCT